MLAPSSSGQVHIAHDLAQREAAHIAVVRGERAVLEDRMREQVGGQHRRLHARLVEGVLEASDVLLTSAFLGAEGDEVVVVEGDAVGAEVGQSVDRLDRIERRTRGVPERVASPVAHGPQPERELVGWRGLVVAHGFLLGHRGRA